MELPTLDIAMDRETVYTAACLNALIMSGKGYSDPDCCRRAKEIALEMLKQENDAAENDLPTFQPDINNDSVLKAYKEFKK